MEVTWRCRACTRRLLRPRTKRRYSSQHGARDYNAAVAALNTLQSNSSIVDTIRRLGPGSNKYAIPEMIEWVRRIGYQPSDFNRLNPVHIAGTKGKGSTGAFVSSILAQYLPTPKSIHAERLPSTVGLYTSPHLRFVRERIQINNRPISEKRFAEVFWTLWDRLEASEHVRQPVDSRHSHGKPVYFHFLTLMAFHCYMEDKVGTAVIECGIGGEYDTTNVIERPSVTGVTSLGIDHQSLLGDTIDSIAWHKAGIFKPGVPAFTVPQPKEALDVLHSRAEERETTLHLVEPHPVLENIQLGLHGDFQRHNASLAISMCASHLQRLGFSDLPDPYSPAQRLPDEFKVGLESARLGGRCDHRPDAKTSGLNWYIDGGHTLESIDVAARWFASAIGPTKTAGKTNVLIFNQQTRDAGALTRRLRETLSSALEHEQHFTHAIFCPNITYKDTGYKADLVSINTNKDDVTSLRVQKDLADSWSQVDNQTETHVLGTIEDAVALARSIAGSQPTNVLVTGSLHLVGGVIEVLEAEQETNDGNKKP